MCGDYNIDTLSSSSIVEKIKNCITANGFEIVMNAPTRVASDSSTCLDHFVFQNCNQMNCGVLELLSFTDHYPVLFQLAFESKAHSEKLSFRDTSLLKNVFCLAYNINQAKSRLLMKTHQRHFYPSTLFFALFSINLRQ